MKKKRKIISISNIYQDNDGQWAFITKYAYQGIDEHKAGIKFRSFSRQLVEESREKAIKQKVSQDDT